MNKEKYNQLTSDLLEKNLVGPEFIDILKNFPIEQSYIYLKLKILNIDIKKVLDEFPNYNKKTLNDIVIKVEDYLTAYCDNDSFDKLFDKNGSLITNDFSNKIPIISRKEK